MSNVNGTDIQVNLVKRLNADQGVAMSSASDSKFICLTQDLPKPPRFKQQGRSDIIG